MNYTRVDPKKLRHAVAAAVAKLNEIHDTLRPVLTLLTDAEREDVTRARTSALGPIRTFAGNAPKYPELLALCEDYSPDAVVEDLDNVEALGDLHRAIALLQQMAGDSELLWRAEAYVPSMEVYGYAKKMAAKNPRLAADIAPLADVFAQPSKKTK